jgi:hypothetical protein
MRIADWAREVAAVTSRVRLALAKTCHDFDQNNYLTYAGALSFFFCFPCSRY